MRGVRGGGGGGGGEGVGWNIVSEGGAASKSAPECE